jgi:hypothetical protein
MVKVFRVKSEHTRIHALPPLRTSLRRDWVSADMCDGVYVRMRDGAHVRRHARVAAHTCAITSDGA